MPDNTDQGLTRTTGSVDRGDPVTVAGRGMYGPTRLRFAGIVAQAWLYRAARWTAALLWSPEDDLEADREYDRRGMCGPQPRA